MESNANRSQLRSFESAIESTLGGLVIYALIIILFVASLLLPPISLGEWILSRGYTKIPTQEGGAVVTDDGAQVTILPEGMQGRTKIKFTNVPRSDFLEGSAGSALLQAAEDIPQWLIMKSPYYRIQFRDRNPLPK